MLDDKKPNHQPDGFSGETGSSITWPEVVHEPLPGNDLAQPEKVVSKIELIKQLRAKEAALAICFLGASL